MIPALPYNDTGDTSAALDDYDESAVGGCSSASTSPDLVYSYTPTVDEIVNIDLCNGSSYDTKIYIYDEDLNLVACNDDYYDAASGCGEFVSFIEDMFVYEGVTYIIVVDGYGGEAGAYDLKMTLN